MDYSAIFKVLSAHLTRIDEAIAQLHSLSSSDGSLATFSKKRHGRKSMGPEERKEVSARMTRYWASQKK